LRQRARDPASQERTSVPVCLPQWTKRTISSASAYGKLFARDILRRLMDSTSIGLWTGWMPVVLGVTARPLVGVRRGDLGGTVDLYRPRS
jgi:hypothetical protein